jgi:hypothetical protein
MLQQYCGTTGPCLLYAGVVPEPSSFGLSAVSPVPC